MKKRIGARAAFVSAVLLVWAVFSPPFARADIGTVNEVDFENVALDTPKTITLVITNLDQANSTSLRFTFSYYECTDFTVDPFSIPVVGPGDTAEVKVTFKPLVLGTCSADFFVYYSTSEGFPSVKVMLKGTGVEEDAGGSAPPVVGTSPKDVVGNVVIDGCDTGVPDKSVNAEMAQTISSLINACADKEKARNHGKFVSCVAHLTNDLKKDGLITGSEKGAIQRCAAKADIVKGPKKK